MGAPWGAMISNTRDLSAFAEAIRNGGALRGTRILSSAAVAAMTRERLCELPAFDGRTARPRQGLAWILPSAGNARYGDLVSDRTYGHHGATCSLLWVDPVHAITFVFLGNKEGSIPDRHFARLSNVAVATVTTADT